MYSRMHPLRILVGGTALLLVLYLGFSVFLGILGQLGGEGVSFWKKDWPLNIAGTIWIVLFSSGVVGCILNLVSALTLPKNRPVKAIPELKNMGKEEYQELDQWLALHVYGLEHLKEMWGEDHD